MASIVIGKKKLCNQVMLFDDEDIDIINSRRWYPHTKGGNTVYVSGYRMTGGKMTDHISLHRAILKLTDHKIIVDHINGNGLDNRKLNLRIATHSQNLRNSGVSKNSMSGYKGVFKVRGIKKDSWLVKIRIEGRSTYFGCGFPTPEMAALAYNEAAKKHFGEFARLNIVP